MSVCPGAVSSRVGGQGELGLAAHPRARATVSVHFQEGHLLRGSVQPWWQRFVGKVLGILETDWLFGTYPFS